MKDKKNGIRIIQKKKRTLTEAKDRDIIMRLCFACISALSIVKFIIIKKIKNSLA